VLLTVPFAVPLVSLPLELLDLLPPFISLVKASAFSGLSSIPASVSVK